MAQVELENILLVYFAVLGGKNDLKNKWYEIFFQMRFRLLLILKRIYTCKSANDITKD